jgi:hypothetical protein
MVTDHFLLKADRLEAYPTSTAHGSHRGRKVANENLFSGISRNESLKLTRADKSPYDLEERQRPSCKNCTKLL